MLSILTTGTLVADPRQRTGASGKAFATALVRVPAEEADAVLVSVIAFAPEAVATILALAKGDSCAIVGRGKLTSWEKAGEEKHGLSIVANRVLSVYAVGMARKATRDAEAQDEMRR